MHHRYQRQPGSMNGLYALFTHCIITNRNNGTRYLNLQRRQASHIGYHGPAKALAQLRPAVINKSNPLPFATQQRRFRNRLAVPASPDDD
jgi:hypothetical protein